MSEVEKPFAGRRILLVDDDRISIGMLAAILGNQGIETALASSGREMMERLAESPPFDLLLLDFHLQGETGPELAAQLRRSAKFDSTPILAMTASVDPQEIEMLLASGMDAYILKPIVLKTLRPLLERWLGQGRAPA